MGTRKLLLGIVTSVLLVGCGGEPPAAGPAPTPTESAGTTPGTDEDAATRATPGTGTTPSDPPAETGSDEGDPGTDASSDPSGGTGESTSDDGPGLEMPVAPEETVESLSDLLRDTSTAPLVTRPLPRADSASDRLVTGFPVVLRPTGSTTVESSSISPSGDRLQVALVASTSLDPARVLVAYRTRLARRGLVEQAAPAAVAGSQAAAFRRGDSVVTITVTPRGARTAYSVHATLRARGE